MSESQQDRYESRFFQAEENRLRDPAWAGVDPARAAYFATNAPAGFDADAYGYVPGQVLSRETVATVLARLNDPGHFEGIAGPISLDQYIADPRSVVKIENGNFVYRPELSQGDFVSADRESFLESLGGIPLLASFLTGPLLQVAGIGSLGAAGASAGSAGAEFFGTQTFLGDIATTAAGGASSTLGGASLAAEEFFAGMNGLVPGGTGVAEAIAAAGANTLTVPAGTGELLSTLKPITATAGAVGSVAGAVGAVASATGSVVGAARMIDAGQGESSSGASLPTMTNPIVFNLPGADMATKTAAPAATASTVGGMNMQTLLTLAVVAVIAFALLDEVKG